MEGAATVLIGALGDEIGVGKPRQQRLHPHRGQQPAQRPARRIAPLQPALAGTWPGCT